MLYINLMPEKKIYILTGAVRTGKTTKLLQWAAGRNDVFGILTPDVGGERVFVDVHTKEQFKMEANSNGEDAITIGRFLFSKKAFKKAIEILRKGSKEKKGWLIVDEIGPLELKGEGFCEAVNEIAEGNTELKILFVVRDSVFQEAVKFFLLDQLQFTVLDKNDKIFLK